MSVRDFPSRAPCRALRRPRREFGRKPDAPWRIGDSKFEGGNRLGGKLSGWAGLVLLLIISSLLAPAPARAQQEDEAAWALWAQVMDEVAASYYQPITEAALTEAAVDFWLGRSGPAAAKLKPADYGADSAASRKVLKDFVIKASTLPGRRSTAFEMVESALAEVVEKQLKFSHYFVSGDVEAFQKVDKGQVGLTLERAEDGRFLCRPSEGAAAWVAGIRKGDELVSIDGRSVRGMALLRAGTLIRGPVDSSVSVQVRQISGRTLTAELRREVPPRGVISLTQGAGGPMIRIPSFTLDTVKELKPLLQQLPAKSILTLDLRGNPGGDTSAAVETAGLFLPGERPLTIAIRQAKGQDTPLITKQSQIVTLRGVTVLVDGGTASAA
ncbi:MAG: peptidase, partial [Verrucomicrobiales bacterium]|nr:peptidase [Verrucomicrobiales bacterium]